jgi:O-antigen ligase
MRILKHTIIGLLLANVLTPLVVWTAVVSPYFFPKAIFSRSLIEITLICALVYAARMLMAQPAESVRLMKARVRAFAPNPLVIALGLFFVSLVVSTLLATDRFWAFWGSVERGDGLWGMLHILLFFILGSIFFKREQWVLFFKLSLVVGLVVAVRAFFQHWGLFGIVQEARPHSFLGNAAYLATQMLFLVGFAALVFYESEQEPSRRGAVFWRYAAIVLAMLFLVVMFITKTRGALLGFAAGMVTLLAYYAFRARTDEEKQAAAVGHSGSRYFSTRTVSIAFLGLMLVFAVVFFATRNALVWQSVPGLDRLAQMTLHGQLDVTTQIRLGLWSLSLEAFKEHPLFGWGPEHYLVAFERYYDPNLAIYGEIWLDRAHNKLIDVLVMQGAFGLLAYLGVFGAAFFLIVKRASGPKAILVALLAAYFVQNLVFFDQLLSYLCFFALLGYMLRLWWDEKKASMDVAAGDRPAAPVRLRSAYVLTGASALSALLVAFSLYQWNAVPLAQAKHYKGAMASDSVEEIVATLEHSMVPYNFAQASIRAGEIDALYLQQFFYNDQYRSNPQFAPLGDVLIRGMQDIIDRHPAYDVRYYTRLVEMLNGYAQGDASYYAKAEPLLRKALEVAPAHQELYFHLAFNRAGQGRAEEAVRTAQHAVDMSPTIARAHFKLALIYAAMGDIANGQRTLARMEALDPSLGTFESNDRNILNQLYSAWGMPDKVRPLP